MSKKICLLLVIILLIPLYVLSQDNIKLSNTIKIEPEDSDEVIVAKAAHVVPTTNQLEALKNEFIAFIHFGPNTFTRKEWGNGMENPAVFDLKTLDTDQDRKSTRLNSSHVRISYAVFCLKK